ncbi:hypothetical protein ACH5RR_007074 [Cinchona calisaya]|uniref:Uncharacterized protein n=1 Tax=Cinchona calisaya TaxID=153742 RepID=A0ABD3AR40_9GENT
MPKLVRLTGDEDTERAEISRFLGGFERLCKRLEKASNEWKSVGLAANASPSLAGKKICLRGITIDASIWTKEAAVSCRVGLYKLRRPGRELKKYFHQNIHTARGDGFGWADGWGGFMKDFSRDTELAVMDYGEIQIVKEEILDLQCGGTGASDNRRIKWDILINGGDGEIIGHDDQGFPSDALYMFSYHLNWNAKSWIYYGNMIYFNYN